MMKSSTFSYFITIALTAVSLSSCSGTDTMIPSKVHSIEDVLDFIESDFTRPNITLLGLKDRRGDQYSVVNVGILGKPVQPACADGIEIISQFDPILSTHVSCDTISVWLEEFLAHRIISKESTMHFSTYYMDITPNDPLMGKMKKLQANAGQNELLVIVIFDDISKKSEYIETLISKKESFEELRPNIIAHFEKFEYSEIIKVNLARFIAEYK